MARKGYEAGLAVRYPVLWLVAWLVTTILIALLWVVYLS